MIIFNLKTYAESSAENLTKLLNALKEISQEKPEFSEKILIAPAMIDLVWTKKSFPDLNFCSQHVDRVTAGSTTGWTPAENVKRNGIEYTLLNHAEHRVYNEDIVDYIKQVQATGLKAIVPCESLDEAKVILQANPFAVAIENKDLIGSGRSITSEQPESVKEFIECCKGKTKIIIGAGVSNGEDIQTGLDMGGEGFILASAFVKAEDPKSKALELLNPFII